VTGFADGARPGGQSEVAQGATARLSVRAAPFIIGTDAEAERLCKLWAQFADGEIQGQRLVLSLDVKDFFPSVRETAVRRRP